MSLRTGMLGIVNYPSISSVKSQKCSPAEQGQVLGSLSAIQSLSICIGPVNWRCFLDLRCPSR